MHATTNNDPPRADQRLADYPALGKLGLTAVDVAALACQGFVSREQRHDRTYFKLRFRLAGQQIVRYIGDAQRAVAIESELAALQADAKIMRQLKALTKTANQQLRQEKKRIEPLLEAYGLAFHGLAIRRPRRR